MFFFLAKHRQYVIIGSNRTQSRTKKSHKNGKNLLVRISSLNYMSRCECLDMCLQWMQTTNYNIQAMNCISSVHAQHTHMNASLLPKKIHLNSYHFAYLFEMLVRLKFRAFISLKIEWTTYIIRNISVFLIRFDASKKKEKRSE